MLLLGVTTTAALCVQLAWSSGLEARLRSAELQSERLLAERILRQAAGARTPVFAAVLDAVAGARGGVLVGCEVRGRGVVVDDAVAWLEPLSAEAVDDLVARDRLDRAARAEFVDADHDAAARAFDALLAGPLRNSWRLRVLAAACWHCRRAGLGQREAGLRDQLRERLVDVRAGQLQDPVVAAAVAAAARLDDGRGDCVPVLDAVRRSELLPFLPAVPFLSLAPDAELRERHRAIERRRALLLAAQRHLDALDGSLGGAVTAGSFALDDGLMLWLGPARDGVRRALVCTLRQWFEAVRAAGRDAAMFEWPAGVAPEFVASSAADTAHFADVPGVRGLVDASPHAPSSPLLPLLLTALLGGGFAFAFVQQRRASWREAQAVQAQRQFLTTVTHELKTPLAGIRLLGEMLAEGRAVGREREYHRLLVAESARLSLLIDNVLDLGRLERGERRYTPRPTVVAEVVRSTLELLAPVLENDGLVVEFDFGPQPDVEVLVDRDGFAQALVVVLDNARKYGASGRRVELRLAVHARTVELTVRDRGPGVPPAERERIFERFVRGEAHRHGSLPGVGIGLFLARSIVRRFGGELVCVDPQDAAAAAGAPPGAVFCFTLPRTAPA